MKINNKYKGKTLHYALISAVMLIFASCVKHDIYNTDHPDKGALVVTADFSNRSSEANVPANYFIALSSGEEWGDAVIVNEVQGTTNVFSKLLDPMTYNLLVYNAPEGITVTGTVATVNSVQTKSRASGYEIEPTPDYLFGSYQQISIAEDDTTWVVAKMKQYVKLLNVTLKVKSGNYERIAKVECSLDGVVTSVDLATGLLGESSAIVSNTMNVDDNYLTTFFRLLGVNTSEKQILTVKITYTNGDEEVIESDISDVVDNDYYVININGNLSLPSEPGFFAIIDGWQQVTDDEITAK